MKKNLLITSILVLTTTLVGCNKKEDNVINVGASSSPHAEILEQVVEPLKEKGYELKITVFDDYVMPNRALSEGTLDANYFQHTPYLNSYNKDNSTDLVSAFKVHYEPFGVYGNGITDLKNIADEATIIVPNDSSNETRALLLLAQEGLITINEGKTIDTGITKFDISNPKGYNIQEVEASTAPAQLKGAAAGTIAVINGNYALEAKLKVKDALAIEDASGSAAQTYANIIACRKGEENSEKIVALKEALLTTTVKDWIESTYEGAVKAIF